MGPALQLDRRAYREDDKISWAYNSPTIQYRSGSAGSMPREIYENNNDMIQIIKLLPSAMIRWKRTMYNSVV